MGLWSFLCCGECMAQCRGTLLCCEPSGDTFFLLKQTEMTELYLNKANFSSTAETSRNHLLPLLGGANKNISSLKQQVVVYCWSHHWKMPWLLSHTGGCSMGCRLQYQGESTSTTGFSRGTKSDGCVLRWRVEIKKEMQYTSAGLGVWNTHWKET